MTPQQLEERITAIGRPGITFRHMGTIRHSMAVMRQWDADHPTESAEHRRLVEEFERATKDAERQADERSRLERAERTMDVKLQRGGIGGRSADAAMQAQDTEALGVVKRWLPDNALTWLVLCGDKGVGKSVAATWALIQVLKRGETAARIDAARLATLSQFDAGAEELAWLKRVDMLLVDDFGTELLTDFAKSRVHELFDDRHESYRRTIITSNLRYQTQTFEKDGKVITTPGLQERLGERICDRLAQAGRLSEIKATKSMRRS